MKAGIRTYLLADPSLVAALATSTSIFSFPAPQDATKPYIMISRVDGLIQNLIGSSLDVYDETWQFDVISKTDKEAETIKELVITRLNGASRVVMGNYHVYSCQLNDIRDGSEIEDTAGETTVHRKILEFNFKRNRDSE
jgi:hypothetical protein